MVNESEAVALFLIITVAVLYLAFTRQYRRPRMPFLYAGYGCIAAGFLFTVLEGFFWHDLFNLLEHLSYAVAGVATLIGAYHLCHDSGDAS